MRGRQDIERGNKKTINTGPTCAAGMAFLIGIAALSIGTLLSLTEAEEPKQDHKVIHLAEVTCGTFTELTQQEQGIIMARLKGIMYRSMSLL